MHRFGSYGGCCLRCAGERLGAGLSDQANTAHRGHRRWRAHGCRGARDFRIPGQSGRPTGRHRKSPRLRRQPGRRRDRQGGAGRPHHRPHSSRQCRRQPAHLCRHAVRSTDRSRTGGAGHQLGHSGDRKQQGARQRCARAHCARKARAGKAGGAGTAPHLAGEMFKRAAGIDLLQVPYRGVGPAVNDLVGGHVQMTFAGWGAVRSPVEAGLAKVLAVAQSKRLVAAPQFPTTAEAGLPGYEFVTWFGVAAPKGTPAPIIATLSQQIHAMQDDSAVQALLSDSGLEVLKESPEQFAARIRNDYARFGDLVRAAKLKPE
ncbi:MAG: hypothetical protein E6G96_15980 [Alphaproteobacteria bacterium]|nr:MAG: hypothetical protein E6G96_15980 [Alphaproteobacteria bacterium]